MTAFDLWLCSGSAICLALGTFGLGYCTVLIVDGWIRTQARKHQRHHMNWFDD